MTLFLMFLLGHIETDTDNFTGEPPYSHHVSANHAENAPNNLLPCYNRSISSSPEEAFFPGSASHLLVSHSDFSCNATVQSLWELVHELPAV